MKTTLLFARKLTITTAFLFTLLFLGEKASASEPVMVGRTSIKLSEIGESETNISLQTQLTYYSALKQVGSNFSLLARGMGMDYRNWTKQSEPTGQFVDQSNEIKMNFRTPGAARNDKNHHWVFAILNQPHCQLVGIHGTEVMLATVEQTEIGVGLSILEVELPAGASEIKFDKTHNAIEYNLEPQVTSGSKAELSFDVDHKSIIMSSLAKNYSNPKFNYLWVARSVAKNTGDQVLKNYRVRFRVADLGTWGPWQKSAHIYPGQTVVDPFFPIFDLEKIMEINGSRPAVIETEMEYETSEGKKIEETDSFNIQILSRNEVVYTSLRPEETTNFAEQFDYAPALMTAMTTPADPVVQQLSGRINGMAADVFGQTIGADFSDAECIAYMSTVWHFIQSNRIAYQSPSGNDMDGKLGQHVKYSRDVLRNRAGTCIDLAILWCSLCEAAGLEPAVILIPGHAFPAVRLPQSRQWVAIESTMLRDSFQNAMKVGDQKFKQALAGQHYLIDITALRKEGVLGLDLPNVSEDYLAKLGYRFEVARPNPTPNNGNGNQNGATQPDANQNNPNQNTVQPTSPNPNEATSEDQAAAFTPNGAETEADALVGTWGAYGVENGKKVWVGLAINADQTCEVLFQYSDADENPPRHTGTWSKKDGKLIFTMEGGKEFSYEFQISQSQLKIPVLGSENPLVILDRKD